MQRERIMIHSEEIRLDGLLKFAGATTTGGEAKLLIQAGRILVNGVREVHRGRNLHAGDVIELLDEEGELLNGWEIARRDEPGEAP
ncbi:MAG: RNA-binding S4 domain-containing protein [Candidatus Eisenbacteria bacterium]